MKIYRLTTHIDIEEGFTYIKDDVLSRDEVSILAKGEVLNLKIKEISLKNKSKKVANIFQKGPFGIFIDEKFKELLKNNTLKSIINFLPANIENQNYYLLNMLGYLECFNYKNSAYTTFKNGNIDKVTELQFVTKNIPKTAIFRLKEKPISLFITENLKNILEKANITGIRFNEDMNLTIGM